MSRFSMCVVVMLLCSHSNVHRSKHGKDEGLQESNQQLDQTNKYRERNSNCRSKNRFEYEDQTNQT